MVRLFLCSVLRCVLVQVTGNDIDFEQIIHNSGVSVIGFPGC